jgi:hypothetical protein
MIAAADRFEAVWMQTLLLKNVKTKKVTSADAQGASQGCVIADAVQPCCCAVRCCRGVLNIVHGTHGTVNQILDHPDIAAVSFVGGDKAGRYIYERAAANGKRVQVRPGSPFVMQWEQRSHQHSRALHPWGVEQDGNCVWRKTGR